MATLPEIRPIPFAPGYGASADGRVFRIAPWARMPHAVVLPRELSQRHDSDGYLLFGTGIKVHRAVAAAFLPNPYNLPEVAHENGVKDDDRLENLRWSTTKDNHFDKKRHGTNLEGEKHPGAKMTAALVLEARRRSRAGESHATIALSMPVNRSVVSRAISGVTWRNV